MKRFLFSLLCFIITVGLSAQPRVYTPSLNSPANNAISQMPDVSIHWNAITGSLNLHYQAQLDTTPAFNSPLLVDTTLLLLTGYKSHNLLFSTKYFWRVRAIDMGETSYWSTIWNFTVFKYLEISSPTIATGTDTTQTPDAKVIWKSTVNNIKISGITNIDYQIDTSSSFDSPLLISQPLGSTAVNYTNINLRFKTYYYWRVRARHSDSFSQWPSTDWTVDTSGTTNDLASAYFSDPSSGFVVGKSGIILNTIDGGKTWDSQTSGTSANLSSIFFNKVNGYVVGDGGVILKTTNSGITWISGIDTIHITKKLNGISLRHDSVGFAVGDSGTILKTYKGLANKRWHSEISGTTNNLMAVSFPIDSIVYAVGLNGTIIKRPKQKTTWVTLTSGTTNDLFSVFFTNEYNGIAVGANGTILKTSDKGVNWTSIPSGTTSTLFSVYFNDANTGYIAGANGTCLKTVNGGAYWFSLHSGTTVDLHTIFVPYPNIEFIVGNSGLIKNNTTGGTAWSFRTIDAPKLTAPDNNSDNQMLDITFTWDKISGVLAYQYQIALNSSFTNLIEDQEYDTNFVKADFLRFGTKYYWRVRNRHATDTSGWSNPWSFTSINTVVLITPANSGQNISLSPVLSWTKQTGILNYRLQLDTVNTFPNPLINIYPGALDEQYPIPVAKRLLPEKTYYWRMRAYANSLLLADSTEWSPVWSFTTTKATGVEANEIGRFNIFPNPASNRIFIQLSVKDVSSIQFTLMDILGKEVMKQDIQVSGGINTKEIQLENVKKGIYIGRITMGDTMLNQKIIIEK